LTGISRLLSYNRLNWATFDERDHFGDPHLSLRQRLELDAAARGVGLPDGPIFLLTHLRYFGYNFNPISVFYCYDARQRLQLILAEVNSTFGESHNYWLWQENELTAFVNLIWPLLMLSFGPTWPGFRLLAQTPSL